MHRTIADKHSFPCGRNFSLRKSLLGILSGLLFLVAWPSTVNAALITFPFQGYIESSPDVPAYIGGSIAGTFSFESTTPVTSTSSDTGIYLNPVSSLALNVSGTMTMMPTGAYNSITVGNNAPLFSGSTTLVDSYSLYASMNGAASVLNGWMPISFGISSTSGSTLMFSDISLPLDPGQLYNPHWSLVLWNGAYDRYGDPIYIGIGGPITSWTAAPPVPLPGAVWLLASGFLSLAALVKSRKRNFSSHGQQVV